MDTIFTVGPAKNIFPAVAMGLLLSLQCVQADPHPRAGMESFAWLSLTHYTRPAGIAQAYVGLAPGADAIGINPSGLSHQKENHGTLISFERWILETHKGVLTYHSTWKNYVYAASLAYIDEGENRVTDIDAGGNQLVTDNFIRPYSMTAEGTLARSLGQVNLGATFKIPIDYLGDTEFAQWAMGWGFDAGIQVQPNTRLLTFGASVLNMGRKERAHLEGGRSGELLPLEAKAGVVVHGLAQSKARLIVDVNTPYHDFAYLSAGTEYVFSKAFTVRGGTQFNFKELNYHFRNFVLGEAIEAPESIRPIKVAGGFSVSYKGVTVEYAGQYWRSLGLLNMVTLKYGV